MAGQSVVVPVERQVPSWFAEIKLCHIDDGSEMRAYCGAPDAGGPVTCGYWNGEAMCDVCGAPMCPRCVQLDALDDALDNA